MDESTQTGCRIEADADLGAVVFLTLLRETGMPIRDMQRFVQLTRDGDTTITERVEVLLGHRGELVARVELLRRHLAALDHKIGIYRKLLLDAVPGTTEKEDA